MRSALGDLFRHVTPDGREEGRKRGKEGGREGGREEGREERREGWREGRRDEEMDISTSRWTAGNRQKDTNKKQTIKREMGGKDGYTYR